MEGLKISPRRRLCRRRSCIPVLNLQDLMSCKCAWMVNSVQLGKMSSINKVCYIMIYIVDIFAMIKL